MPDDGRVASTLAGIRERHEDAKSLSCGDVAFSQRDVPLLLTAIEAVLEKADEWDAKAKELDAMAERADARGADPGRTILLSTRAQAHNDFAHALREAISTALTGKEAGDDG